MNKIIFLLLFFVSANTKVNAQFSKGAIDSAKNEILELTSEWNKAIKNRDSLTLNKILASDYSLNGNVTRSIWMNNTLHHIVTDTLEILGEPAITFYGEAAKSEGVIYWKASFDGTRKINAEFSINDIWIKRDNRWQVLIRMSLPSKMR